MISESFIVVIIALPSEPQIPPLGLKSSVGMTSREFATWNPKLETIRYPQSLAPNPYSLFPNPCLLPHQFPVIIQSLQPEEPRGWAEFFFDAQQLVVLGDAIGARG